MPQVVAVKEKKPRWGKYVLAVIVLAILVAALWAASFWLMGPSISSVIAKSQNLNDAGNFSAALSTLKAAQHRAISSTDRENMYLALGVTEYNLGDYSASVKDYQQADSLVPNQESTLTELAQSAHAAKDNAAELSADKQILPIIEAHETGPTKQNDINDLQNRIAELQN